MGCAISSKRTKPKSIHEEEAETSPKRASTNFGSPLKESKDKIPGLGPLNYTVDGASYRIIINFMPTPKNQSISVS
ncbi:unnamed protein product [Blepharisma stoltei]|uniref:Uncharacterized protein n=1 Tax=Blepharisma stoltei TaxID=1481888 RepID=A0AAU9JAB8_9CILI|nr:unnamed protein product [Blepharisma stoltei]